MNKKAQGFIFLRVIAFVGMFFLLFALALSPIVSTFLGVANLDAAGGLGAWLLGNMNLWIILGFVIFVVGILVYGFGGD